MNKTVLDSEFQVVDSGNQVLDSWFFVSGTWILDSNRQWDPNSLSCIPDVDTWMKWITSVQEIFLLMYRPIEILVTRPPGHARDLTTTTWTRGGCGMCLFFPGPWSGVCHQTEKRRKTEAKGICYQRTKGYTGKGIPRQDWNLLILTGNKMLLGNFQKLSFQFK